jgi:hypothetical protein
MESSDEDDDQKSDETHDSDPESDEYDERNVDDPEAADAEILTDNWAVDVVDTDTAITCHDQTVIANALDKCRRLVKLINKSSILSAFIQRLKIENKVNRALAIDCKSRWSSTHRLISSVLTHKQIITRLFAEKYELDLPRKRLDKSV